MVTAIPSVDEARARRAYALLRGLAALPISTRRTIRAGYIEPAVRASVLVLLSRAWHSIGAIATLCECGGMRTVIHAMPPVSPPSASLAPGGTALPLTVHVLDDDASYLGTTCRLLRNAGFEVRGFTAVPELLAQLAPATRGCVVANLLMPEMNGLDLQQVLARSGATLPVVFVTGQADIASAVRAMREGAVDYLEKHAPADQLIAAVRSALERGELAHAARTRGDAVRRRFAALTERELEVLRQVMLGKMNKEIAAALGIHERTVKLHRTAITSKSGVHSVAELATLVHELRLLEAPGLAARRRQAG
jgi:two-component system response regulator FixJ